VHLVELSVMEQRYQAVMAVVQDGWMGLRFIERRGSCLTWKPDRDATTDSEDSYRHRALPR
jgi:hypothetical protein